MEDVSFEKISELLSSPDLMKNVQNALSQLNLGKEIETPGTIVAEENSSGDITKIMETLNSSGLLSSVASFLSQNKTERIALLSALRPFLSSEKKGVLDSILQLLKVANVLLATNLFK